MNYLKQITSFECWCETKHLPGTSQLLWYKLMAICNRSGWLEWFQVDNQRLMVVTKISREATFIEVRNRLIDAGLIEFQKGRKGCPNKYKICTFKTEVQTEVQSVVQTEVQTEVQTVAIYKLNETKQNKTKRDTNKKENIKDKKLKIKIERNPYGEYNNVLLSDDELNRLQADFQNDWRERIERLSTYMASTGKYYAGHLATIKSWDQNNKPDQKAAAKPSPYQKPSQVDMAAALYAKYADEEQGGRI